MSRDVDIIRRCVADCAKARDWRGRWRQERKLRDALLDQAGTSPMVCLTTAAASADLGAWISARAAKIKQEIASC